MIKITILPLERNGPYGIYKEDIDKPRSLKRIGIRQTLIGAQILAAKAKPHGKEKRKCSDCGAVYFPHEKYGRRKDELHYCKGEIIKEK
jgi:hypothetical protein